MKIIALKLQVWETLEHEHPLGGELTANIQSQTTYAEFHKESEQDDWEIRVLKQRVWIAEVEYELKEIYGDIVQGIADDDNVDELGDGSGTEAKTKERSPLLVFFFKKRN